MMKRSFRFSIGLMLLVPVAMATAFAVKNGAGGASFWPIIQTASAQSNGRGQPENCSNRVLSGRYGYDVEGTVFAPPPVTPGVAVGVADFDGQGSFTASDVGSFAGTVVPRTATGVYTVKPDCTATVTLTIRSGFPLGATFHINGVILGLGNEVMLIQTDPGTMFTGTAKRQ